MLLSIARLYFAKGYIWWLVYVGIPYQPTKMTMKPLRISSDVNVGCGFKHDI